jgi:predicted amidohydrolase YtcJ
MTMFRTARRFGAAIGVLGFSHGAALAASADLVLYNAQVLTVDRAFSIKKAVAVKDGKIIAVGGDELLERYNAPTKIDLHGKTLMPGFMDTHLHIRSTPRRQIDMAHAHSIADIQRMLRAKAAELGPGEWIIGAGWSEYELAEKRRPLRADLDAAAPDNPVVLTRAGGHSTVANSLGLKLAKIGRNTPDPEGGLIEKDAQGEPNGILRERPDLYRNLLPQDTFADLKQSYVDFLHDVLKLGITSFMSASTYIDLRPDVPIDPRGLRPMETHNHPTLKELRAIYDEYKDGLPRVTEEVDYPGVSQLKAFPYHTGYGDDRLRLGPIGETPVDGGFTGPTAYTIDDYNGMPGFRGRYFYTKEQLQDMVDISAKLGWQLGLHAIGDAAIVETVDAYDKALKTIPGQEHLGKDRRWFLAHYTIMPPTQTSLTMAADGIAISQQPNFSVTLVQRYVETVSPEKVDHNNAIATPLKQGIAVTFGSDNIPIDPRIGLYGAITRKGQDGVVHGKGEAVSRAEAIRLYTAAGPYLSWEEKKKGSLEVGKFADMIVLDSDPLTAPEAQLLTMKVLMTFVDGKLAYDLSKDPHPLDAPLR